MTNKSPEPAEERYGSYEKRLSEQLVEAREFLERIALKSAIVDQQGNKLCTIDYVPMNGELLAVHPEPYENRSGLAEQTEERVYCTDKQGMITEESITRGEARARKKRYLVVTALIHHGRDVLLQKRSRMKDLDPGMESASAHGVAKELLFTNGMRVKNVGYAGLVNLALEIQEELRHGMEAVPFTVRLWQGTEAELFLYAKATRLNDPNTVWIVRPSLYNDAGYPLKNKDSMRTRLVAAGYIFCSSRPPISMDPTETEDYKWVRSSSIVDSPTVTLDTQQAIDEHTEQILIENSQLRAMQALMRSGLMQKREENEGNSGE